MGFSHISCSNVCVDNFIVRTDRLCVHTTNLNLRFRVSCCSQNNYTQYQYYNIIYIMNSGIKLH